MLQIASSHNTCSGSCLCSLAEAGAPDTQMDLSLVSHYPPIKYKKGQTLFYQNTRPMGVFCLRRGWVKLSNLDTHGREHILSIAQAGDFLGYEYMLNNELYGVSATVLKEVNACFIPKTDFEETVQTKVCLENKLLKMATRELQLMRQRLAEQVQRSVRERLATTILMLQETCGCESQSMEIDLILSRKDLAGIVGTATETLIRLLSEFRRDGLIKIVEGKIYILNHPQLIREADLYANSRL